MPDVSLDRLRRTALAAALVVVGSLGASPASAGPPVLSVTGRGSGHLLLHIPRSFALDDAHVSVDTRGTYAGLYLEPLTGAADDGAGVVVPLGFARDGFDPSPLTLGRRQMESFEPVALTPGPYRVHLLADAPATVRVRLTGAGARSLSLRTTRGAPTRGWTQDITPAAPSARRGSISFARAHRVPSNSITVVAFRQVWRPASGMVMGGGACLHDVPALGSCFVTTTPGSYGADEEEQGDNGAYWSSATYYFPDDIEPGDRTAVVNTVAPEELDSLVAFGLSVPLSS